jgi:hypothetical protein
MVDGYITPGPNDITPDDIASLINVNSLLGQIEDNEAAQGYIKVSIDGQEFKVNPRQIEWSKEFKIVEYDIPYYKNKTQSLGSKLWRCSMTIRSLKSAERRFLWDLGEPDIHPGPHLLVTAGATSAMCVYIVKKGEVQASAEGDIVFLWSLDFIEANDAN